MFCCLQNLNVHYRVHKSPPVDPIMTNIKKPISALPPPSFLLKFHYNSIAATPCCLKLSLPLSDQKLAAFTEDFDGFPQSVHAKTKIVG